MWKKPAGEEVFSAGRWGISASTVTYQRLVVTRVVTKDVAGYEQANSVHTSTHQPSSNIPVSGVQLALWDVFVAAGSEVVSISNVIDICSRVTRTRGSNRIVGHVVYRLEGLVKGTNDDEDK
jgi:hypothetical protein